MTLLSDPTCTVCAHFRRVAQAAEPVHVSSYVDHLVQQHPDLGIRDLVNMTQILFDPHGDDQELVV